MSNQYATISDIIRRAEETLQIARCGLEDLLNPIRNRRFIGLRNLIVFGRSFTWVLQNLKPIIGDDFNTWYLIEQNTMATDPLMQYFVKARNQLEKEGKLNISTYAYIRSFSSSDIQKFGPPPTGAKGFFIGDNLGGSGWEVELPGGRIEKYYVDLPQSIGEVKQIFSDFPEAKAPELAGKPIEELSEMYLKHLEELLNRARDKFLGKPNGV